MKKFFNVVLIAGAVFGLMLTACQKEPATSDLSSGDSRVSPLKAGVNGAKSYIVILNDNFEAASALAGASGYDHRKQVMAGYLNRYLNGKGIGNDQVDQIYTNVYMGFAARLSGPQLERLSQDPMVKSIEADQMVDLGKPGSTTVTQPVQQVPWGITRVGGPSDGTGKKAWIIDTGVDYTHPDLNVDTQLAKTFVPRTKSATDDNGHGTHVAGIIAAKNNSIGVVGVAAGATVVPVKVLDRNGSGSYSVVIAGVDYVASKAGPNDAANMSLGGPVSTSLDDAVKNLGGKTQVALAAGNEAADASNSSPAHVNGTTIYTVSAMDSSDKWAYFSNFGNPPVDYCAPGVSILSCYKGGGYATMSGTSMAAPHVAGLLLLGAIKTNGYVTGDPDGNPDPIAHN